MAVTNLEALRFFRDDVRPEVRPGYDRMRAAYAATDPLAKKLERIARRTTTSTTTRRSNRWA